MFSGTVRLVGDNIHATDLVSADHDIAGMTEDWDTCAEHLLETIAPQIKADMRQGDILVGGANFGRGHAHYHAAAIHAIDRSGFSVTLAETINPLFFRGAIDAGIAMHAMPGIVDVVSNADDITVDLRTGLVQNHTRDAETYLRPASELLLDILAAGGSEPWAYRRRAGAATSSSPAQ